MKTPDPLSPLRDALKPIAIGKPGLADFPDAVAAALKSAIRASITGRQQKKNLDPVLEKAVKAFVRTLRRRAAR